uniref:Uncharacterized protein n=1 Tax=Panagrolaimus sp. JU765 TaxID=591449 RepID=A0AC34QEG3_9BILA
MTKNFILNPFLGIFPTDIRPNLYCYFFYAADVWYPGNVSDIVRVVNSTGFDQNPFEESYFISALAYMDDDTAVTTGFPQNNVVFTGGPLHDDYFQDAVNHIKTLTANGNTFTVVFVKPNMNLTNYQRIPQLKLVQWSNDSSVLLANIRQNMNCLAATTPASGSTTPPTTSSCKSHIPFAYDMSKSLSADQYSFGKQLILDPFLTTLFSSNVQPSWFGIFDTSAYFPKSRPNNITDIANFVKLYPQLSGKTGNLDMILKQLLARNVMSNNDTLPVNTVIFTGSDLPANKVEVTVRIVDSFTTPNNTLTIVFTKPDVNQQNYQAVALVSNVKLVQYNSNKLQMVADLRQAMNCN